MNKLLCLILLCLIISMSVLCGCKEKSIDVNSNIVEVSIPSETNSEIQNVTEIESETAEDKLIDEFDDYIENTGNETEKIDLPANSEIIKIYKNGQTAIFENRSFEINLPVSCKVNSCKIIKNINEAGLNLQQFKFNNPNVLLEQALLSEDEVLQTPQYFDENGNVSPDYFFILFNLELKFSDAAQENKEILTDCYIGQDLAVPIKPDLPNSEYVNINAKTEYIEFLNSEKVKLQAPLTKRWEYINTENNNTVKLKKGIFVPINDFLPFDKDGDPIIYLDLLTNSKIYPDGKGLKLYRINF